MSFETTKNSTETKNEFAISGKEIHDIKDLRDAFDMQEVLSALMDGSLENFLKSHYYEFEAIRVKKLSIEDKDCARKLCEILGVDYLAQSNKNISSEELQKRREQISAYTTDEAILSQAYRVALNQEEMGDLLNKGEKEIYLCGGSFSIPLTVPGITYTGVANPKIEWPFTKEQYRRVGITVENINLPEKVDDTRTEYAAGLAKFHGYDDFPDNHSMLTTYIHELLSECTHGAYKRISYDSSNASKDYSTETQARAAAEKMVEKAHAEANRYLTTGYSECVAEKFSQVYAASIEDAFDFLDDFSKLCTAYGKQSEYQKLEKLIKGAKKTFKEKFEEELDENTDFYSMYSLSYFIDSIHVEEHDCRISEGFARMLEGLFSDSIFYSIGDVFGIINEIENDLNDRLSTYSKNCGGIYEKYVAEIEKVFEQLSKALPEMKKDEDMEDYISRACIERHVK